MTTSATSTQTVPGANPAVVLSTDVEGNYSALSASALQTYIKIDGSVNHSYGGNWGTGKQGGSYSHVDSAKVSGSQSGGVQTIFATGKAVDSSNSWQPDGDYSNWGQSSDVTFADTVVPYDGGPVADGSTSIGLVVPPSVLAPPELVLEYPFQSVDLHQGSSYQNTWNDGTVSQGGSTLNLDAWHSETILGLRGADGSVTPIATLAEADGFSLSTSSSNSTTGPNGSSFDFNSVSMTGYESNSGGPVQSAGMSHALDSAMNAINTASYDPIDTALGIMHGAGASFGGGTSASLLDVATVHAGIGGYGGKG